VLEPGSAHGLPPGTRPEGDDPAANEGMSRGSSRSLLGRLREFTLVPVIGALLIIGAFTDPVFLTPQNLINVLQQQTELSLVVLALSVILIAGTFDLSLESTVGLAPALAVLIVTGEFGPTLPELLTVPLALAIGASIGAINGLLILKFRLNAFIVTLGMLIILRGLQVGLTGGRSLFDLPESLLALGSSVFIGIPLSVWICGVGYAIGLLALRYLRQGRAVYAIGGNIAAAKAAGIRSDRTLWSVLIIGGTLAALAGILLAGRLGSIAAAQGQGMIFTVFAAAVIGGISLDGGKGSLFGALCGVLVLGLIQNILTLAGVPGLWFGAIYGGVILGALVLSRVTSGAAQE
jgi:ribose/xylose/arabinose/galactoside ABC-type transport system permease subunit